MKTLSTVQSRAARNCWNSRTMLSLPIPEMKMMHFTIIYLSVLFSLNSAYTVEDIVEVSNNMTVPDDKRNCECSWTQWMDSGPPSDDGGEIETYTELRRHGYKFCPSPVDIQCYSYEEESIDIGFASVCDVGSGLTCSFICSNYAVRVGCCYCPPEAIGPEFQISSQSNSGGCLKATHSSTLTVESTCDLEDRAQSWVWVSRSVIKNVETKQCLALNGDAILMENCDVNEKKQKWKYIDKFKTLQPGSSSSKNIKKVGSDVILDTSRGRDSQWRAGVKEGKTSLKNMRNFPCEPLAALENGEISCTLGDYVSSECEFSCQYGYSLPDDVENLSKCTDDGYFTVDTPVCKKIECLPHVDELEHGTVTCSNDNNLDSSCLYKCNEGYAMVGRNQLICTETGEWTDSRPTCERIICKPDLARDGMVKGAVNCTDGAYFASKCTHTCVEGYELVGSNILSCQVDERWDNNKPVCNKIQCPPIIAADNSQMTCSAGTDFSSECKFVCEIGYTIVGSETSICTADKTWGSGPPTCERKTCNTLTAPENGNMFCDDENFYASRCSFTCKRGFDIEGGESLKCTNEGWNHGTPICKQITCSRQTNPVNGAVSCTNVEIYGSTCTFSCSNGFKLNGVEVNECIDTGWDNPTPTCEQITCTKLLHPKNGRIFCKKENLYGSDCVVLCNKGYHQPEGSDREPVTCQLNGLWTSSISPCTRIRCNDINIPHGIMTCSDMYNFNSTCTFQCKDGYNLLGANEATCKSSGWDAQAPNCGRLTCSPPLARPSNGQIDCKTSGRPVCSFSCNPGYELNGETTSECQRDETWSVTDIPICKVVRCSRLPSIPSHGNRTCTDGTTYNSVCDFKCKIGYSLVGEQQVKCTEDRRWDHKSPVCEKISCPELTTPDHGRMSCSENYFYESKCQYSCDKGYKLVGETPAVCHHNTSWSITPPYCNRITCSPRHNNPSNGKVDCSDENNYGSSCLFSCDEGFSLEGIDKSICEAEGWTLSESPVCRQITCPLDTNGLPNGSRNCDRSDLYKSNCTYTCNHGFKLVGAKYAVCTEAGTWSNITPKCKEINCPEIPKIQHGLVICDKKTMYSSKCQFLCDNGYVRTPDITAVQCMGNRRWNPAGFPICEVANVTVTTVSPTTEVTTTAKPTTTSTTTTTIRSTTTERPVFETTRASLNGKGLERTAPPPSGQNSPEETTTAASTIPESMATSPDLPVLDTPLPDTSKTPVDNNTNRSPQEEGGFPIIVVAAVAAVAVIAIIVLILVLLWRRKYKKKSKCDNGPSSSFKVDNRYDHTELGLLLPNGNGTVTGKKYGAISMDRLEMEYNKRHADDDKMFREEYHSLVDGTGSKEAGGRAKNKDKNRYTNILPYDHSRVILPKIGIDADSDYINASFVDGYKHKGKFIAAQGPKPNTVADFWRMIWEQNVSTVIMATNLEERKEPKCALYWPESEVQETYGELMVTHLGENHLVDYTIRLFSVQKISGRADATLSTKRNITQYHFTSWPDFGVPKSPSGILKFLRKIKHGSPTGYGPTVVHCSAGVGRTGTFICIDAMMDMISRENKIDVFGFSTQMRQQRPEMVQTEQQYIFIYQAILEHHLYGDTEVEASEVSSHIEDLMQRLPGNVTGMEHEFKKLTSIRIQKEHMRAGNHPANMRKNRVLLILPYDWNRVMLPIKRGQENTDYINASYIDGYRQKDAYIATQGPPNHTIEDFWRMIWNSECASIVMLTELVERGQAKCAQYWPNDGMAVFGDIEVELIETTESDDYTERDFRVSNKSSNALKQLIVKQFHYHGWPEVGAPVSGYSMIELVEAVQKQQQSSGNNPIVIHCSAGAGRTGAFCALSTALEQVKAEGVLDMFQIVKCLRMQRPHMVQTLDQYEFCYRAVQEYIDSMSEYYNFK